MIVLVDGDVRRHSTEAARSYVLVTRDRLLAELSREGDTARKRRSFQQLQRSITAEELSRTWPLADLEAALAD